MVMECQTNALISNHRTYTTRKKKSSGLELLWNRTLTFLHYAVFHSDRTLYQLRHQPSTLSDGVDNATSFQRTLSKRNKSSDSVKRKSDEKEGQYGRFYCIIIVFRYEYQESVSNVFWWIRSYWTFCYLGLLLSC